MRSFGFGRGVLGRFAAAALLAGCGGSQPPVAAQTWQSDLSGVPAPTPAKKGIYVSEYSSYTSAIYGYRQNNSKNRPPICSENAPYADNIAVDAKGNVIVTQGYSVTVFKGPSMCGPMLGTFGTGWSGYSVDAASADAANGTIAVAAVQNGSGGGSIELCTLKAGCGSFLRSAGMNIVYGVAVAKNGDCWASWEQGPSYGYASLLTFFKWCSGAGEASTGYKNLAAGGLDIDRNGNLVAVSCSPIGCPTPALYVYSGCKPACKKLGGPFPLKGAASYGHLDKGSTTFATADSEYGQVDIYKYAPTSLTYLYSFNNGLSASAGIFGAAYDPPSKE
jgi:hypothetical protein